jgi:hypothetical protein
MFLLHDSCTKVHSLLGCARRGRGGAKGPFKHLGEGAVDVQACGCTRRQSLVAAIAAGNRTRVRTFDKINGELVLSSLLENASQKVLSGKKVKGNGTSESGRWESGRKTSLGRSRQTRLSISKSIPEWVVVAFRRVVVDQGDTGELLSTAGSALGASPMLEAIALSQYGIDGDHGDDGHEESGGKFHHGEFSGIQRGLAVGSGLELQKL